MKMHPRATLPVGCPMGALLDIHGQKGPKNHVFGPKQHERWQPDQRMADRMVNLQDVCHGSTWIAAKTGNRQKFGENMVVVSLTTTKIRRIPCILNPHAIFQPWEVPGTQPDPPGICLDKPEKI